MTAESIWPELKDMADKRSMESNRDTFRVGNKEDFFQLWSCSRPTLAFQWMLKLGPKVDSELCFDLVSFILDCDMGDLPQDTVGEMIKWLEGASSDCDGNQVGIYCVDSVFTFVKQRE